MQVRDSFVKKQHVSLVEVGFMVSRLISNWSNIQQISFCQGSSGWVARMSVQDADAQDRRFEDSSFATADAVPTELEKSSVGRVTWQPTPFLQLSHKRRNLQAVRHGVAY